MRVLLILVSFLWMTRSIAHPGIGLVYDGDRTIYYTDLTHIWKLDIENGEREIAVSDVHSHELCLDRDGNLYGEHYWYDADQQIFKNYLWKLNKKGVFSKIREEVTGENTDFGFVRDSRFRSYVIDNNDEQYVISRIDSTGPQPLVKANLRQPGWKYMSNQDILYFTDENSLYSLKGSELNLLAGKLKSSRFPFSLQAEEHNLYGIWTDRFQNIYLANYGGRLVKQINQQGEVFKVLKSDFFWSPVNGVFDHDDQLWLMESTITGRVRIRKVIGELKPLSYPFLLEKVFLFLFGLFLIASIYDLLLKRIWLKKELKKKRRS